jgi:curved DNA-binding protein CbpA
MMLHPDKTDGDVNSAEKFKEATEAYDTLSNHGKRTAYDRLYASGSGRRKPPPNYRKVYAPSPPPGFKTFDPKEHYDMHYGDGQMREEIDRAIKRAKEAGGKLEYESPLGPGFAFSSPNDNNPYSRRAAQGPQANGFSIDIDYEESHFFDSNNRDTRHAKKIVNHREFARYNLYERRRQRVERSRSYTAESTSSCSVM